MGKNLMSQDAKNQKREIPQQPTQPQPFARGMGSFVHDLFKLAPAMMKKNTSYDKKKVTLIDVEHGHFFHSADRKGKPNKFTTATGGHYHEVSVDWNKVGPNGGPVVHVGPALREKTILMNDGVRRKVRDHLVEWPTVLNNRNTTLKDDHTHTVEYLGREVLTIKDQKSLPIESAPHFSVQGVEVKEQ